MGTRGLGLGLDYIDVFSQYPMLVAQAMASLGHAPLGRAGGRGIRHTHCPAASNSGASRERSYTFKTFILSSPGLSLVSR